MSRTGMDVLLTSFLVGFMLVCSARAVGQMQPAEENEEGKIDNDRLERDNLWRMQRADAHGRVDPDALWRAKEQLDLLKTTSAKSKPRIPLDAGITSWEWLGPGNINGLINALVIHPTLPNIMWAASEGGGIWRTDDGGSSWYPLDDFFPGLKIAGLVMDPTQTDILYAGVRNVGIMKSTDGGGSWSLLPSTANANFRSQTWLAHSPTASNTLIAGTGNGVYRSTDGGISWSTSMAVPNPVIDIKAHPTDGSKLLVGTQANLYYSSDSGKTFSTQTTGGLNKPPSNPGWCYGAFYRGSSSFLYLGIAGGPLWRSTNAGSTWDRKDTLIGDQIELLWVSPTDPNLIVCGFLNLWRSTTGGTSFKQISIWEKYVPGSTATSPHADHRGPVVNHPSYDGSSNKTLFVCNDGGVAKAVDITTVDTLGWVSLNNNLGVTQFYGGAAARDGSVIVGGAQDAGWLRYRPSDGVYGWVGTQSDGGFCAVDYSNPARTYTEYQYLHIERSDDSGRTYHEHSTGITGPNSALSVPPLVMDPNNPKILIVGGSTIWRTTDGADHWYSIRDASGFSPPLCSAIDFARWDTNTVWLGYNDGTISYTTNARSAAPTWINVDVNNPSFSYRYVTDIAINPFNKDEVFVTIGGYSPDAIWRTTNSGISWELRQGTLPGIQVNSIRYHPLNPDRLYIGTDLGVFATEDQGATWSAIPAYPGSEGPANVQVNELFFQGDEYLIAATYGRGMYRCHPFPVIYVDFSNTGLQDGTLSHPFKTVQQGIDAVSPGSMISIWGHTYDELNPIVISKRGRIVPTPFSGPAIIK